jgi:hypothetical protein
MMYAQSITAISMCALIVFGLSTARAQSPALTDRDVKQKPSDAELLPALRPSYFFCDSLCWTGGNVATCFTRLTNDEERKAYKRLFPRTIGLQKKIGFAAYNNADVKLSCPKGVDVGASVGHDIDNYLISVHGVVLEADIIGYNEPPGGNTFPMDMFVSVQFDLQNALIFPDPASIK